MTQESEEQYRLIVENPVLGIAWGTLDGRLLSANSTFCELLESTLEELKGRHLNELVHPDDFGKMIVQFQQLVKGEIDTYQAEERYITRKKNIKWVKVNVTVSRNDSGEIKSVIAIVQDVSERKQTEEKLRTSETNLRFVLDTSDTAYILLDAEMRIVTTNRLANQWTVAEFDRHLNEGDYFIDLIPERVRQAGLTIIQNSMQGTPHVYEERYTDRKGIQAWYHVRFDSVKDERGNVIGLCIAASDTTRYRAAQAEIKSMNDSLEKKVKERTSELEIANKELEAFTYSVSHDLMAPLRIIDGFSQVLLDDYRNKLDEEGFQTLQVIKRNATRMGELVNDLLNLARLGRANLVKRNLDMTDLVTAVIDEMRFSTNKLAAKIKLHELKPADCDHTLIKQVWSNLLSNAIKYSKNKENPQIEIGCVDKSGQIVYYIKDNGVGFDTQYSGKLFGVFQRLHKATDFPGTGVGLAIVYRIITRHGGKVWADAKVNEGAVFYFTLP